MNFNNAVWLLPCIRNWFAPSTIKFRPLPTRSVIGGWETKNVSRALWRGGPTKVHYAIAFLLEKGAHRLTFCPGPRDFK